MFRITKRDKSSLSNSFLYRILGFIVGMGLSMLFIKVLGHNPFKSMTTLLSGAFGTSNAFRNTLTFAIPLATTALGLSIAFRMKFWNIGGEGQFYMGAFAAAAVALYAPGLPAF